jgi:aspartate kinase
MQKVVCKFGGSSLATAKNIRRVAHIVLSGKRSVVVVSAPGKRNENDEKITDLLIESFQLSKQNKDFDDVFEKIEFRFKTMCTELGVSFDFDSVFGELKDQIAKHIDYHFVLSRGEFLCAKIVAKFLNYEFLDAKDFIVLNAKNKLDEEQTKVRFDKVFDSTKNVVVPGFYGVNEGGDIVTFSRGGSDVTGAILAHLLNAELYENFTDVDGVFSANPKVVAKPKIRRKMTYAELRSLSFFGANVLHPDCAKFLEKNKIILNLKNTFAPSKVGTFIVPKLQTKLKRIAGIAGTKNVVVLRVKKFDASSDFDLLSKIKEVLVQHNLKVNFLQIGIDEVYVFFRVLCSQERTRIEEAKSDFLNIKNVDEVSILDGTALVCVAGESISQKFGDKVLASIAKLPEKISFVFKNFEGMAIIFGVNEEKLNSVINFLHKKII